MQWGATHFHRLAKKRHRDLRDRALSAGVWVYLFVYCALVVGFGAGLYDWAQPSQYPNPGIDSQTISSAARIEPEQRFQTTFAAEPSTAPALTAAGRGEEETIGEAVLPPPATTKADRTTADTGSRRTRVVRRKKAHAPMPDYAAQPFFGSYRFETHASNAPPLHPGPRR